MVCVTSTQSALTWRGQHTLDEWVQRMRVQHKSMCSVVWALLLSSSVVMYSNQSTLISRHALCPDQLRVVGDKRPEDILQHGIHHHRRAGPGFCRLDDRAILLLDPQQRPRPSPRARFQLRDATLHASIACYVLVVVPCIWRAAWGGRTPPPETRNPRNLKPKSHIVDKPEGCRTTQQDFADSDYNPVTSTPSKLSISYVMENCVRVVLPALETAVGLYDDQVQVLPMTTTMMTPPMVTRRTSRRMMT
eukprot:638166-Rhodomonas_salina.1